jgi:glutaredoxin-related protein
MNLYTLRRSFVLGKTLAPLVGNYPTLQARRLLCASTKWDKNKLDSLVQKSKVVVFMKGVPAQPMCGFSNAVVQVLRMHGVEEYDSHNILDDEELRSEMKVYSNWPTFPQVIVINSFLERYLIGQSCCVLEFNVPLCLDRKNMELHNLASQGLYASAATTFKCFSCIIGLGLNIDNAEDMSSVLSECMKRCLGQQTNLASVLSE